MYKLVNKEFTAYNNEKFNFYYREDTNDFNTILSITLNDEYQTSKIAYKPGDTFIDIGAHIGIWAALMERLVPQSHVIAVEPLLENTAIMAQNTKAVIIQKAVANRSNTKIKIYYPDNSESGLHHKFVGNAQKIPRSDKYYISDSINLQDLLHNVNHVRVLKIDCEGGEHQFFKFADKESLSRIDYIIGEYHNPDLNPNKTRQSLFRSMRGLFTDLSIGEESILGHFLFKKI